MENIAYIAFYQTEHDPSICMLYKGRIYAIELERLSRIKHGNFRSLRLDIFFSDLIKDAIQYLLSCINCNSCKIKGIFVVDDDKFLDKEYFESIFDEYHVFTSDLSNINKLLSFAKLDIFDEHHFFHGLSSYFSSGFERSAILVMDSNGYDGEGSDGEKTFVQSMYYGNNKNIKLIHGTEYSENQGIYGIGTIYELISEYIIGMESSKVMGLSAYGDKDRFKHIKLFDFDGMNVFFSKKGLSFEELKKYITFLYKIKKKDYNFKDITKSIFADIAAHLQYETEKAVLYLGKKIKEVTNLDNLCIAGGVGLNVIANRLLVKYSGFKNVFIPPFVGDQGISLGLLYFFYYYMDKRNVVYGTKNIFLSLGKNYNNMDNVLNKFRDKINIESLDIKKVANDLYNNKIIGIFYKGSEFGPRALGYRSILASPLKKENNIKVNNIKNRELWRPLAPIILENKIGNYLLDSYKSLYMFLSSYVLPNKLDILKGVVHVDNSVRYQTIDKNNDLIYKVLMEFYKITGVPVLINTSLNVKGEPIVETPEEAIKLFLSTDLDYVIINDYFLSKNKKYSEFKFDADKALFNLIKDKNIKRKYLKYRQLLGEILFKGKYDSKFIFKGLNIYSYKVGNNIFDIIYENKDIFLQIKNAIVIDDILEKKKTEYLINRINYLLGKYKNNIILFYSI